MYEEEIWTHLRRKADRNWQPKPVANPKFNNPRSWIFRSASWLDRFGVMPNSGGLLDQSLDWVEDMELYFGLDAQTQREYQEWLKAQGNANAG